MAKGNKVGVLIHCVIIRQEVLPKIGIRSFSEELKKASDFNAVDKCYEKPRMSVDHIFSPPPLKNNQSPNARMDIAWVRRE